MAGVAEMVKSSKYIVKVSVAAPVLVVVSVPVMVKLKGFEVEADRFERVKTLVVGMVG